MIRSATLADIDHLLKIEKLCFSGGVSADQLFSKRRFRYLVTKAHAYTLVEENQEIVRAYAITLLRHKTSIARIYSLAVDPNFQHRGIGSKLLAAIEQNALEKHFVRIRAEVRCDNLTSQKIFEKQGYKKFGTIINYYGNHIDAFRFQRSLTRPPIA